MTQRFAMSRIYVLLITMLVMTLFQCGSDIPEEPSSINYAPAPDEFNLFQKWVLDNMTHSPEESVQDGDFDDSCNSTCHLNKMKAIKQSLGHKPANVINDHLCYYYGKEILDKYYVKKGDSVTNLPTLDEFTRFLSRITGEESFAKKYATWFREANRRNGEGKEGYFWGTNRGEAYGIPLRIHWYKAAAFALVLYKLENAGISVTTVNSWIRTKRHNNSLPSSSPNSSHLYGIAMDIQFPSKTIREQAAKWIKINLWSDNTFTYLKGPVSDPSYHTYKIGWGIGIYNAMIHVEFFPSHLSPRSWEMATSAYF